MIRQPIVAVLGHVDSGKTEILDRIRGTMVGEREAGHITQHIGATEVPVKFIKKRCKKLLAAMNVEVTLPGLLFIDTPGHHAFSNLRKRGGSTADLAILVIDATAGVQPQTVESLRILKSFKVPFVVAFNKIDRLKGWISQKDSSMVESMERQSPSALERLDQELYKMAADLSTLGYSADRFDRVDDFTKTVAVVPCSAKNNEGVSDLLAILSGLAQKYLTGKLEIEVSGPAKGTVLEVKPERGFGTTLDVLVYDGIIKKNDPLVVGGLRGPIRTKVRALLKPKPLNEMRDPHEKFEQVDEVHAARGVKVVAPDIDDALAGAPVMVGEDESLVEKELEKVRFAKDAIGVVAKADALGSLEALLAMLDEANIPVRKADVGAVTRRDIVDAANVAKENKFFGAILAFHTSAPKGVRRLAEGEGIEIIGGEIIYRVVEEYQEWVERAKEEERRKELEKLPRPAKFQILKGFVFRQSGPAVVGVEVGEGVLKPNVQVMNAEGDAVGRLKGIEDQGENLEEALKSKQAAVSIEGPTVGRQIEEGDTLYTFFTEREYAKLKKLTLLMSDSEKAALEEILQVRRKSKPTWGMLVE